MLSFGVVVSNQAPKDTESCQSWPQHERNWLRTDAPNNPSRPNLPVGLAGRSTRTSRNSLQHFS